MVAPSKNEGHATSFVDKEPAGEGSPGTDQGLPPEAANVSNAATQSSQEATGRMPLQSDPPPVAKRKLGALSQSEVLRTQICTNRYCQCIRRDRKMHRVQDLVRARLRAQVIKKAKQQEQAKVEREARDFLASLQLDNGDFQCQDEDEGKAHGQVRPEPSLNFRKGTVGGSIEHSRASACTSTSTSTSSTSGRKRNGVRPDSGERDSTLGSSSRPFLPKPSLAHPTKLNVLERRKPAASPSTGFGNASVVKKRVLKNGKLQVRTKLNEAAPNDLMTQQMPPPPGPRPRPSRLSQSRPLPPTDASFHRTLQHESQPCSQNRSSSLLDERAVQYFADFAARTRRIEAVFEYGNEDSAVPTRSSPRLTMIESRSGSFNVSLFPVFQGKHVSRNDFALPPSKRMKMAPWTVLPHAQGLHQQELHQHRTATVDESTQRRVSYNDSTAPFGGSSSTIRRVSESETMAASTFSHPPTIFSSSLPSLSARPVVILGNFAPSKAPTT